MSEQALRAHDLVAGALRVAAAGTRAAFLRLEVSPDDETAVHDLRVGIRRIRTVLRSGSRLYGAAVVGRIAEGLRAVAQATNVLRDEEVLAETLELLSLQPVERAAADAWLRQRAPGLTELRRQGLESLLHSQLNSLLDELISRLNGPAKRDLDAGEYGRQLLRDERVGIAKLLPTVVLSDVAALHRLRIRFKRLRYLADMFVGCVPATESAPVGPDAASYLAVAKVAAGFQKELGVVHDVDVVMATVALAPELSAATRGLFETNLSSLRQRLASSVIQRLMVELASVVMPDALGSELAQICSNSIAIP